MPIDGSDAAEANFSERAPTAARVKKISDPTTNCFATKLHFKFPREQQGCG
jgi:hypothetical protein